MGIDAQMLLRVQGEISDSEILSLAVNAYERFGSVLWVYNPDNPTESDPKRHCVARVAVYWQDGDDIIPEPGETFLEVYLSGRYYGEGYERGNLPGYIMLAEYFESVIPGVRIMYGGDSSGVCAGPFGKQDRAVLFDHFVKVGHNPYSSFFDQEHDGPECDLCKIQMIRCGWGANYKEWYCRGCGTAIKERDGIRSKGEAR